MQESVKQKICLVSLGCPKNLDDSELMLGMLKESGAELVTKEAEADVLIVNTCGFIGVAKEESIDAILSLAEYKKTGRCHPHRHRQGCAARLRPIGCGRQRRSSMAASAPLPPDT